MVVAPTHARRSRRPSTEAALWLVWRSAQWTGLATTIHCVRTVHGSLTLRQVGSRVTRMAHVAILRIQLETGGAFDTPRAHVHMHQHALAPARWEAAQ